jgi:hypothetical protein
MTLSKFCKLDHEDHTLLIGRKTWPVCFDRRSSLA